METTNWIIAGAAVATFAATLVTGIATLLLVGVTAIYVCLTHRLSEEAKQTRMDAHRPIVVPANWAERIQNKYVVRKFVLDTSSEDDPYLKVRNIGAGPALNIRVRLSGSRPDEGEYTPRLLIDESRSTIRHLAPGEADYAVQWGADVGQPREARDIDLKQNDVLTIAYDDLFRRRVESRYERIQGKWIWLGDNPAESQWPHAVESSLGL